MSKQFLLRNISRKVSIFLEIDLQVMLRIKKDRATRFIVRQTAAVLTIDFTHFIPVHIDGIQEFTQGDVHHFRVRNNNSALTKVRLSSFNFIINRI